MCTALVIGLCLAAPALGQTVVNTFQVGSQAPNGYNGQFAWFFGDVAGSANDEFGFLFTAGASGGLTSARTSAFTAALPSTLRLSLYADGGVQPGALLGSWTVQAQSASNVPLVVPATTTLDGSIVVEQGRQYWLTCTALGAQARPWRWYTAGNPLTVPDRPNAYKPRGSTQWEVASSAGTSSGAFELTVPAPGGAVMLAGLLGLLGRRRRV